MADDSVGDSVGDSAGHSVASPGDLVHHVDGQLQPGVASLKAHDPGTAGEERLQNLAVGL